MFSELNVFRGVIPLLAVLVLACCVLWALRRFKIVPSPGYGKGHLKVVEVLPLDTHRRLMLVSCDSVPLVILASPKGDQLVALPRQEGVEPSAQLPSLAGEQEHKPYLAWWRKLWSASGVIILWGVVSPAMAQGFSLDLGEGGALHTRIVQLMAMLTIFSLAPSILVMVTSFTRVVVVLSFLRNALGLQGSPPNGVIVSLALFLSFFIMSPVLEQSYREGVEPYMAETLSESEAWKKASAPFHQFMLSHVREKDLGLFMNLADLKNLSTPQDTPWRVLVPAFMISELARAFEIGFLLFVPFLIIDMVVASVLMSMGMMMLPPMTLALPFKIIFFVLVDGWFLLAGSLVRSYGGG